MPYSIRAFIATTLVTLACPLFTMQRASAQHAESEVEESQAPESRATEERANNNQVNVAGTPSTPPIDGAAIAQEWMASLIEPGGLTADAAMARAVDTAPSMSRANAAVAIAEAGARRAWQSLFPQVEVSASYTRLSRVTLPDLGGSLLTPEQAAQAQPLINGVDDPEAQALWNTLFGALSSSEGFSFPVFLNRYSIQASLTYPVSDLFFTILPAYRAQQSAADAQRAQSDVEARSVRLRARETLYQVLRARASVIVAERTVEQLDLNVERMERLVEGGVTPRASLLQLQAQAAQARVGVANARAATRVSEEALRVLLHMESGESLRIAENLTNPPPPFNENLDQLIERALDERTEVRALRRAMEARERGITATLGRRYPQLLLQAGVEYTNPNQRIIPNRNRFDASWSISVILRWSPNEFGAARQDVIQARAALDQMQADLAQLRDGVRLEIRNAAAQYEAGREVLAAAEVALLAAHENREVRAQQVEAGAAVATELVDAETALAQARLSWLNAAIELHLQYLRLRFAAALDS